MEKYYQNYSKKLERILIYIINKYHNGEMLLEGESFLTIRPEDYETIIEDEVGSFNTMFKVIKKEKTDDTNK